MCITFSVVWIIQGKGIILPAILVSASLIDECNLFTLVGISLTIGVVIPFINCVIPHPFLAFRGYHFYNLATENGISTYILISKKEIRNEKYIKVVGRIFVD